MCLGYVLYLIQLKQSEQIKMKKYKFNVVIAFLNIPHYKTKVAAINCYQAKQEALKEHRIKSNCSTSEMYDASKSTAQIVNWAPVTT